MRVAANDVIAAGGPIWLEIVGALAIPLAIAALPFLAARGRRRAFLKLLDRELEELSPVNRWTVPEPAPLSEPGQPGEVWRSALPKRFIHEQIVYNTSENREFLLSLPPDLVYDLTQMWNNFHKAQNATDWEEVLARGRDFCRYLELVVHKRARAASQLATLRGRTKGYHPADELKGVVNAWWELLAHYEKASKQAAGTA